MKNWRNNFFSLNKKTVLTIFATGFSFLFIFFSDIPFAQAADAWYDAAWNNRVKITVNSAQVPSTQTNFPVYVNLANLPAGFFSHVKSDGGDIRVTKSDGTTELAREVVSISTSASTGELWFKADSISSGAYFYVYYGNFAASEPTASSTYGSQNVWDSSFNGVWHAKEATGANWSDSTSSGNTGTNNNVTTTTGKIGSAGSFNGSSSYLSGGNSWPTTWNEATFSSIFYASTVDKVPFQSSSNGAGWGVRLGFSGNVDFYTRGITDNVFTSVSPSSSTWYYFAVTFKDSTDTGVAYLYNISTKVLTTQTITISSTPNTGNGSFLIGKYDGGLIFDGILDEIHVSSTARSANWIATEYNNQSAPTTFYAVASEEEIPWFNTAWGYRKKITIDHTKVANTNQAYFPVLISRTDTDWKDTSNSGHVGQSDGGDFVFTSANGTTKLDHEIEKYTASSGELIAWVKVPTLSTSIDTVLYAYYGNASVANQWNTTGTWDDGGSNYFQGVWHSQNASTTTVADSTANGATGTKLAVGEPVEATGKIDKAQSYDGSNDYVDAGTNTITGTNSFTLSAWINTTTVSKYSGAIAIGSSAGGQSAYIGTVYTAQVGTSSSIGGGFYGQNYGSGITTLNQWVHVAMTFSGGNAAAIYVDGVQKVTNTYTPNLQGTYRRVGRIGSDTSYNFSGLIDEARIASTARSADWVATEYNNQSSPSTFYAVASETSSPVVISITLDTDGTVAYGNVALNAEKDTTASGLNDTQTARNNGTVAEDFNIKTSDATGGTQWTVGAAAGSNIFMHNFSTNSGSSWTSFDTTNSYKSLATNIASAGTKSFDLKIHAPTATTDYQQKTITVTIQAVQH